MTTLTSHNLYFYFYCRDKLSFSTDQGFKLQSNCVSQAKALYNAQYALNYS